MQNSLQRPPPTFISEYRFPKFWSARPSVLTHHSRSKRLKDCSSYGFVSSEKVVNAKVRIKVLHPRKVTEQQRGKRRFPCRNPTCQAENWHLSLIEARWRR